MTEAHVTQCPKCGGEQFYATETISYGFDVEPAGAGNFQRVNEDAGVDWDRAVFRNDYRVHCSKCFEQIPDAEVTD
jgi:hypothetical protein